MMWTRTLFALREEVFPSIEVFFFSHEVFNEADDPSAIRHGLLAISQRRRDEGECCDILYGNIR